MALSGTLRIWNDDRGYGFIAPRDGGRELFVHISAFPRDGSRPTVGEALTYELGTGKDGKPQAIRVHRQALGRSNGYSKTERGRTGRKSLARVVIGLVVAVGLAAFGYRSYQQHAAGPLASAPARENATAASRQSSQSFRCDGRTHCSQMTSCAESKFFLKNCPGVQMDGNNDGVPCEQQWCTSPFAN